MAVDLDRMRLLWEEGRLKTIEIAQELGTTLDGVRGIARRRKWVRGPILRGKPPRSSPDCSPALEEAPKIPPPPEPPKPRKDPPWSTIFTRLAEEHEKMDKLLAETRRIPRLVGM